MNKQAKIFYEKQEYSTFLELLAPQQRFFLLAIVAGNRQLPKIADYFGVCVNQASAIASTLKKAGLIKRENGKYAIVDNKLVEFMENRNDG